MAGKTYEANTRIKLGGDKEYKQAVGDVKHQLEMLNSEMKASQAAFKGQENSMEALRDKQEKLKAIYAQQARQVEIMTETLDNARASNNYTAKALEDFEIKLNNAKAAMNRTAAEIRDADEKLEKLGETSEEAAKGMNQAGKAADEAGDEAEDAEEQTSGLRDAMSDAADVAAGALKAGLTAAAGAIAALGAAALKGGQEVLQMGTDFTKGTNQLSAMTGATGEDLAALGTIANEVWRNNFGESIGEVNEALATTKTNTGLVGDALKQATEDGYLLKDTFGFEFAESSRAASALMQRFGISSKEAYNLIAIGAQNGANQNGDLLDVLSEYAPKYAELGLSADQFMQTLVNGAESGAFSIDKVGDAVKEFSIRAVDGSDTTSQAFADLGLNAQQLSADFAAGGPAAQKAFTQVVNALKKVKDPLKQSQIAVALFGTQYEDLGPQVLDILGNIEGATYDTVDALGQINEVKYDDLDSALEGAKRLIQSELLPTAQSMSAKATTMVGAVIDALADGFQPSDIQQIGQTVAATLMDGIAELRTLIQNNSDIFNDAISQAVNIMATALPGLVGALLPAAMGLLQSVVDAVASNAAPLASLAVQIVTDVSKFLIENAPKLLDAAVAIILGLTDGLTASLPGLIPVAVQMMVELATGLIGAIPQLVARLPEIIDAIWTGLTNVDWAGLGTQLFNAIMSSLSSIGSTLGTLFSNAWTAIQAIDWAAVGTTIETAVSNVGTWLSGKFSEAWTAIQGIDWAGIGSTIETAVSNVGTWLSGKFSEAWTAIKGIDWAGIGSTIETAVSNVGTWLSGKFSEAWTAIKGIDWAGIGSTIETAVSNVGTWLGEKFTEGWEAVKAIDWAAVGTAVTDGISGVSDFLGEKMLEGWEAVKAIDWAAVGTTIETGVSNVGTWLSEKFTEGFETVKAIDWASIGTAIIDALSGAATWVTDTFSGLIEAVKTIAGDIWAGLTGGLSDAATAAKETLLAPFESVITWIKDLFGIASPSTVLSEIGGFLLDGLGAGLLAGVEAVLTTVGDVFGRIWDAIKKIFGFGSGESDESKDAKQAGKDIMSGLKEGVTGSEEDLKEAVKNAASNALQAIRDEFGASEGSSTKTKEIGVAAVAGLTDGLDTATADTFAASASTIAAAITSALDTAMGSGSTSIYKPQGQGVADGIAAGITAQTEPAATAATNLATAVTSAVSTGIADGQTSINTSIETLATNLLKKLQTMLGISGNDSAKAKPMGQAVAIGVNTGMKAAGTAARYSSGASTIRNATLEALRSALGISGSNATKFESIGTAIANGVARGISNGSSKISSAARSAARAAYNAAKRELGISSPSRKMAEIGQWFDSGFAQGIERNMQEVMDSAGRLANMAAAKTTQTRASSAAAAFDLDYDRLGESVARANRAAGVGTAVLDVDGYELGSRLERHTSRATRERSVKTVKGRTGRMVLA